jgi:hypothetical protein
MDEGLRSRRESNWMKTWRQVCNLYLVMRRAGQVKDCRQQSVEQIQAGRFAHERMGRAV